MHAAHPSIDPIEVDVVGSTVENDLAQRGRGQLECDGVIAAPEAPVTVTRGLRPFARPRTIDQKIVSPMKTRSSMR